jgi:hypothetical protein
MKGETKEDKKINPGLHRPMRARVVADATASILPKRNVALGMQAQFVSASGLFLPLRLQLSSTMNL